MDNLIQNNQNPITPTQANEPATPFQTSSQSIMPAAIYQNRQMNQETQNPKPKKSNGENKVILLLGIFVVILIAIISGLVFFNINSNPDKNKLAIDSILSKIDDNSELDPAADFNLDNISIDYNFIDEGDVVEDNTEPLTSENYIDKSISKINQFINSNDVDEIFTDFQDITY